MSDRASLKRQAKELMRTTKPSVYVTSLVYIIIVCILSALTSKLSGSEQLYVILENYLNGDVQVDFQELMKLLPNPNFIESILILAIEIISAILGAGIVFYYLRVFRGLSPNTGSIFDGFNYALKIILIKLVSAVFIFLWSLLLIIPGIIAAYRYSFAIYILAEHPDYGVMQCIRESKRLTKGYKGRLFVLELSFIGWLIVSSFVAQLIGYLTGYGLPFFDIWLAPYMGITVAAFYAHVVLEKDGVPLREGEPSFYDPDNLNM